MPRTLIDIPDWDQARNSITTAESALAATRDAFRAALDPDLLHTNWIVSDITKWTAYSTTFYAYAFVIYHTIAGVKSGPAWLFVFGGERDGSANSTSLYYGFASLAGAPSNTEYLKYFGPAIGSINSEGGIALHYCETGGTINPYGGGWDSVGDLTGGDFSAPTFNPYSEFISFMPPDSFLKGRVWALSTTLVEWCAVMDHDKPFIAVYFKSGFNPHIRGISLAGNIIKPYLDTDPYTQGVMSYDFTQNNTGTTRSSIIDCYTPLGVRDSTYVDLFHTLFTQDNSPNLSGEYPWDVVTLTSSTNMKGYADTDVIRNVGAYTIDYRRLYSGGLFYKCHNGLVFPYVPDATLFPGG